LRIALTVIEASHRLRHPRGTQRDVAAVLLRHGTRFSPAADLRGKHIVVGLR
jgi:hypothetical protein